MHSTRVYFNNIGSICTDSLRQGNGLSALQLLTRAAKSSAAKSSAAKTRSMESRLVVSVPRESYQLIRQQSFSQLTFISLDYSRPLRATQSVRHGFLTDPSNEYSISICVAGVFILYFAFKSVGVRKLQVAILARSPREMSLTYRIFRGTSCHEFASQFGLDFFIRENTRKLFIPIDPLCGQVNY